MTHDDFNRWMHTIASVSARHCFDGEIYAGAEGAKRFAREVGAGLPDFGEYAEPGATYSAICVIAYHLKPPIDAMTWLAELRKGIAAANAVKRTPIPDDYTPRPFTGMGSDPESYKARWRGEAERNAKV